MADNNNNNMITELSAQGILAIYLNRPEKLNALNDVVLTQLNDVFTTAQTDSQTKAVLLTGNGKAFCAGADIRRLADLDTQSGYQFAQQGQAIFHLLETLGKPSLAAINGYAFGGGCELAMAASLRIASEQAKFGQPEVKLGVIPGYGGTQRLARLIGKGRAIDLCITGRTFSATDALQWGLISEITTPEQLLPRAEELLQHIVSLPPAAVASTLQVIHDGFDLPLEQALQLEALHFSTLCTTADKQQRITAFLQKS